MGARNNRQDVMLGALLVGLPDPESDFDKTIAAIGLPNEPFDWGILAPGLSGTVLTVQADGSVDWSASSGGGGSGSVTSVSWTGDGTVFTASADTPVTTSGTLTPASLIAQAKNTLLAGPATGSNAAPTFRAIANSDLPAGAQAYAATGVKTGAYAAAVGDLVPVDTTSGNLTITLPTVPADRSRVAVKHVVQGGTNTVTLAAGGSDVFNASGGSTTKTLTLVNQAIQVEYAASPAIWYVIADDLPLSGLDSRYAQVTNNLSDLTAVTARSNLSIMPGARSFGVSGTPALNATTPPIYLATAMTCAGVVAACGTTPSGSSATVTLQTAPDGTTWSTLATVSITVGSYSGTAACTTAISAGTYLRALFSAVNSAANITASLGLKG